MTKLQAEIIIALADSQMNITTAAKKLYMHRSSVSYHVQQIRRSTGKDPINFYDMCELLPTAWQVFTGEVAISVETRNALLEIGRKAHGGNDA